MQSFRLVHEVLFITFHNVLQRVADACSAKAVLDVDMAHVLQRQEGIVRDDVGVVKHDLRISTTLEADVPVAVLFRRVDPCGWNRRASAGIGAARRHVLGFAVIGRCAEVVIYREGSFWSTPLVLRIPIC